MQYKTMFLKKSVLPGFGITFSFTLFYLFVIVLIPLSGLVVKTSTLSWSRIWDVLTDARLLHACFLSFGLSAVAALINLFFGTLIAWMLTRYSFPGKRLFDALVDVPFALPTAVAGIALSSLYATNGWIGSIFAPLGIRISFTPLGILVALVFVGLPFVVRTVQPVLEDLDQEVEEAAASLGATRLQIFLRVVSPQILPAVMTGFAMAFARSIGEYGSVVFIAGNIPYVSEIIPLMIVTRLEQYQYAEATAIALLMLCVSFCILLTINTLQKWSQTRTGRG